MGFIQIPKSLEEGNETLKQVQVFPSDFDLLVLINKSAIISAIVCFAYGCLEFFTEPSYFHATVTYSLAAIFVVAHLLFRYGMFLALKIHICLVLSLWVTMDCIFMGGDFSQSAIFLCISTVTYVLYQGQRTTQIILVSIVLGLFTFSTAFLKIHGPLFENMDQPFDELLAVYVCVIWIYSIFGQYAQVKQKLINDLEQKNQTLMATKEELERFTNIASHDLKSPLRNISSFIGLIERDIKRGNTENLLGNLEFAKKGAQQMHHLVQGILEISNVNQNAFDTKGQFSLSQLLEDAVTNLRLEIAEKNAVVQYGELPTYHCNDVEMTLLFQNLLQNGIKYNKSPQPAISITAEQTDRHIKLSFTDNGIGIEPQFHSYVFEHFKRLHSSQEYMGTGLGLSLCQKIAQKHKGEIQLISALGKGSQFVVLLPTNPQ
jgi:signal transduction histidine kinase